MFFFFILVISRKFLILCEDVKHFYFILNFDHKNYCFLF